VPVKVLQESPFFLTGKDRVIAKVSAKRDELGGEWSQYSESNVDGVKLSEKVSGLLQRKEQLAGAVGLSWYPFPEASSYEVYQNGKKIAETTQMKFTVNNVTSDSQFSVRARGPCGLSDHSEVLLVKAVEVEIDPVIQSVPTQMKPPQIAIEGCNICIHWSKPANGGTPIEKYNVKVRGSDSRGFISLSSLCSNPLK
jgi:hypothetical protein